MNAGLIELLVASGTLPPSVLLLRASSSSSLHADPTLYRLQFSRPLDTQAVERLLASLTALLPPWWRRVFVQPVVSFELEATPEGVVHRLVVPSSVKGYIDSALRAHAPGVRYEEVADEPLRPLHAVEYRTTTDARPLRVNAEALAGGLLAAVQSLSGDDHVLIQWQLTAAWPTGPARLAKNTDMRLLSSVELLPDAEAVAARRAKLRAPLLLAAGRIGASASTQRTGSPAGPSGRRTTAHYPRSQVHFTRRRVPAVIVARRMELRRIPLTRFPSLLNVEEAVGLLAWPLADQRGALSGGCRLLPVPRQVARVGTVLGEASYPAQLGRPVALDLPARYTHVLITGPTGVGKSTLATQIAIQDLAAGHGLVAIDPKGGDLTNAIVERMPEHRLRDLIVLDPASQGLVVGYNPLRVTHTNQELVVEQVLGVMRRIWLANWGPRTDALLRACLFTLSQAGGMTICEIPALLTDEGFRKRLTSRVSDPFGTEAAWGQFDSMSEGEKTAVVAPLLTKIQALTTRPRLRAVFGQAEGAVDFARIIRERKILLVSLSSGTLGSEAARLLGSLLFAGLWDAVSARGQLPPEQRAPIFAVLDEFQNVVQMDTPVETVLSEARSYRLGLVMAHQHLGQLDGELKGAVLANARSKVVFQTSHEDASVFAREFGGLLTPDDLVGIPAYEAVVGASAGGQVQPPTTIRTLPLPPKLREAEPVLAASQQRWGVDPATVDAELVMRQHPRREPGVRVGRARREPS